jgi:hypothetical protein
MSIRRHLVSYLFAAVPAVLSAQAPVLGAVDFNGDVSSNGSVGGYAVSPYKGTLTGFTAQFGLPGGTPLDNAVIWCVDFRHWANSRADSYFSTAFTSNTNGITGNGDFSKTRRNRQAEYMKAAWLIEQYDANAAFVGRGLFNAENIQGTIWNLFGGSFNGNGDFFTLTVPATITLSRNWYVLSDDNVNGEASSQEYLTYTTSVVHEPSTAALMGAGLLVLGLGARRRAHSRAAAAPKSTASVDHRIGPENMARSSPVIASTGGCGVATAARRD